MASTGGVPDVAKNAYTLHENLAEAVIQTLKYLLTVTPVFEPGK